MPSTVPRARARGASPEAPAPSYALSTQAISNFAGHARARANPVAARRRSISRDSSRATRPPASLYADYILRLQDTEPESLEIMLRLLLVALPLVVALPAAFDKPELLQFEAQSPLQLEVRSPPSPALFAPSRHASSTR